MARLNPQDSGVGTSTANREEQEQADQEALENDNGSDGVQAVLSQTQGLMEGQAAQSSAESSGGDEDAEIANEQSEIGPEERREQGIT